MMSGLPDGVTAYVIRVKADERVFYVRPQCLMEELDGLRYKGFGRWAGGPQLRPAPVDMLLDIQRDLRLHVRLPDESTSFCDLSHDEVDADPYGLIAQAREDDEVLWEYIPSFDVFKPATTPAVFLDTYAQAWEKALF